MIVMQKKALLVACSYFSGKKSCARTYYEILKSLQRLIDLPIKKAYTERIVCILKNNIY